MHSTSTVRNHRFDSRPESLQAVEFAEKSGTRRRRAATGKTKLTALNHLTRLIHCDWCDHSNHPFDEVRLQTPADCGVSSRLDGSANCCPQKSSFAQSVCPWRSAQRKQAPLRLTPAGALIQTVSNSTHPIQDLGDLPPPPDSDSSTPASASASSVSSAEPVPELPIWAMLLLCFAGLGLARFKRGRKDRLSPGIE